MLQRTLQFRLGPVHFWCCEKPGRRNLRERTSTGHFDTTQETLYKTSVQPADLTGGRPAGQASRSAGQPADPNRPAGRLAAGPACMFVRVCREQPQRSLKQTQHKNRA